MSLRILALAAMASFVAAQATSQEGYGRFPCSIENGDGTFSADPNPARCTSQLVDTGLGDGSTGLQSDEPNPVNSVCVQQADQGFFCGLAGATCTTDANCDNGACLGGVCSGGFTQACNNDDTNCLGYLYCSNAAADGFALTCGGVGAYCLDFTPIVPTNLTDDQIKANRYCDTGYCSELTGNCDARLANGDACTDQPLGCPAGSDCQAGVCAPIPVVPGPSQLTRSRRSLSRRGLCPASHTACAVGGSKAGFECVDTTSNLEQCGACASAGGVDCTSLPGVEAVGCVAGQCEVWSCAEGFSWDAATASCQA